MKNYFTLFAILFITAHAFSQNGSIKGVVKTSDNQSAKYINIGLKGTKKGTTSTETGEYELKNISPGTYTLTTSFIGLETTEQAVEVKAGETTTIPDIIIKENEQQLEEVIITSYKSANETDVAIGKVPIKPIDLPQSTSSINKEILDQQQTTRMSDALKNFNGVYLMGTAGGYQEEIAARGFAFKSSNTFKNGVRFNNTAMPEMSALEKVEVLKGSSAILFGNVAAGGVINLVTRKPLFETGGEVSMRVGSYLFYKPSFDVYGSLNDKKTIAYRINTTYEKANSFRDNVKSERYYVNPSILFKLNKKTELLVEGDYLNDHRTADFGVGAINYHLIDIPRSRFLGVTWGYYNTEQKSASATLTHRFNKKWVIRSVTSYQSLRSDLFSNQRPNGNSKFISENGDWIRGLQRTSVNDEYYITQLDLIGNFTTGKIKHTFIFGADADKYKTNTLAYNAVNTYDTVNVFDLNKYTQRNDIPEMSAKTLTGAPIQRAGVYVQDLIKIADKINVLAGVRYSYLETFSDVYTYSNKTTESTRQYDNAISPRVGLVYKPIKTTAVFASYSNSFAPNTGVDITGKALAPSITDQIEAGVKNDLFKGLLSLNVTAYQIKCTNLAQVSLENGNTNKNIKELAGEVTGKGIEVDVHTKDWNGLSVIAGYSYNETRYTKSNTYIVGSLLLYNPRNTANGSLFYSFRHIQKKWLQPFSTGVSVLYFGDRAAGRLTRVTVPNDTYKPIPLPAYTTIDATLGYNTKKFYVRFKASNIFNALSYNVHDDNSVNPIAPRQFAGTVGFKF